MTWKTQKLIFWLLAIPLICLVVWGSVWLVEKRDKPKEIQDREQQKKQAKLPVKIYKGLYDGKEFIIEEYETYRDK